MPMRSRALRCQRGSIQFHCAAFPPLRFLLRAVPCRCRSYLIRAVPWLFCAKPMPSKAVNAYAEQGLSAAFQRTAKPFPWYASQMQLEAVLFRRVSGPCDSLPFRSTALMRCSPPLLLKRSMLFRCRPELRRANALHFIASPRLNWAYPFLCVPGVSDAVLFTAVPWLCLSMLHPCDSCPRQAIAFPGIAVQLQIVSTQRPSETGRYIAIPLLLSTSPCRGRPFCSLHSTRETFQLHAAAAPSGDVRSMPPQDFARQCRCLADR